MSLFAMFGDPSDDLIHTGYAVDDKEPVQEKDSAVDDEKIVDKVDQGNDGDANGSDVEKKMEKKEGRQVEDDKGNKYEDDQISDNDKYEKNHEDIDDEDNSKSDTNDEVDPDAEQKNTDDDDEDDEDNSKSDTDEEVDTDAKENNTDNDDEVDDDNDRDDDDGSYHPVDEAAKKSGKKATIFRQVTNGLDVDMVTDNLKFIVEGKKSSDEFSDWTPSPSFMGLVYRWAGKKKFHYFDDIKNCTEVVAVELGYSSNIEYLMVRAWTFTRRKVSREDHIEYRRLDACLTEALGKKKGYREARDGLIEKFKSMITALYRFLESDDQGKEQPSLALINMHKLPSFQHRITTNTQIYHLAVATVLYIFGKHIPQENGKGLEELTKQIFGNCSKKSNFIQGLFDLLLFFSNDTKILSSGNLIKELLLLPGAVLNQVHSYNMGVDHDLYLDFLQVELDRMIPKAGVQKLVASSLSNAGTNHAVVRKRVATLFLNAQKVAAKSKKKKALPPPSSTSGPNSPSPKRQKSSTATPSLASIPTLNQLLTINPTNPPTSPSVVPPLHPPLRMIPPKISNPPESFETDLEKRFSTFVLADQASIDLLGPPPGDCLL